MRSTTENVAGIASNSQSPTLSNGKAKKLFHKTQQMKEVIRQELLANYPDIIRLLGEDDFAPHILTFGIKGVRGEVLVHAFEDYIFSSRRPLPVRPRLGSLLAP